MRIDAIAGVSFALTLGVIGNAFYRKEQFYPSVVYITKSNPSMAIMYLQALILVVLFGKLMRKVFFGQLRAAETEHLIERSWYAVTETCLAFTVFRDDFSPRFIALFTILLFLKCFHWLVEDRVDFMERSPAITLLFHLRVTMLLVLLGLLDSFFVHHAYYSTLIKGASVQLVFGFEYAILLTVVLMVAVRYVLHAIDSRSENPWESKSVYLLYTELLLGFAKVVLYLLFMAIMVKVHTLPLFAIRPMYLTARAFKKAVHDVIMSRRAIRNMNTLYPDATAADLESSDNVCIICREEMQGATPGAAPAGGSGAGFAKKLPCGHIFHASCLRSWFQRQQTCPTCRIDILRNAGAGRRNANGAGDVGQRGAPPAAEPDAPVNNVGAGGDAPNAPNAGQRNGMQNAPNAPWVLPPGFPPPPFPPPPGFVFPPPPPPSTAASADGSIPSFPPFHLLPPPPFPLPPPLPPTDFAGLSDEELRALEGDDRGRVEARIRVLRGIQTLLDAAMIQMNQYVSLASAAPSTVNAAASAGVAEHGAGVEAEAAVTTAATVTTTTTSTVTSTSTTSSVGAEVTTTNTTTTEGSSSPRLEAPTPSTGAVPKIRSQRSENPEAAPTDEKSDDKSVDTNDDQKAKTDEKIDDNSEAKTDEDANELRRRRLRKLQAQNGEAKEIDGDLD